MKLFNKSTYTIVALFAIVSLFGQPNKKMRPSKERSQTHQPEMVPAYNASSGVQLEKGWDIFVTGSFTYWQSLQDDMELAVAGNTNALPVFPNVDLNAQVIEMDFSYAPGFKVGIGANLDYDHWDTCLNYTWYRNTSTESSSVDSSAGPAGVNTITPRFGDSTTLTAVLTGGSAFSSASENWKVHLDLLDLEIGRSEFVGKSLTFRPFFSVRGAWIRQRVVATYLNQFPSADEIYRNTQVSNSWAVGPRAGITANWIFWQNLRFYGFGSGDVLFTQYPSITTKTVFSDLLAPANDRISLLRATDENVLRAHLEFELGLGWGMYFCDDQCHLDLSAGYNFQVFFRQNMFYYGSSGSGYSSTTGDLYLQGLTITTRFDF